MKFKERYIFGFKSELHPDTILWRYTDEAEHQANNHKTYKPKQLKLDIRHELLKDILQGDSKLPQKRP